MVRLLQYIIYLNLEKNKYIMKIIDSELYDTKNKDIIRIIEMFINFQTDYYLVIDSKTINYIDSKAAELRDIIDIMFTNENIHSEYEILSNLRKQKFSRIIAND